MYYVYILLCKDGSLYTGISTDVERRFKEHQEGKGSKYVRARKAHKIVYTEGHTNRSSALRRELAIKKLSKQQKLDMAKRNSGLGHQARKKSKSKKTAKRRAINAERKAARAQNRPPKRKKKK